MRWGLGTVCVQDLFTKEEIKPGLSKTDLVNQICFEYAMWAAGNTQDASRERA